MEEIAARRRDAALAGHRGDQTAARDLLDDPHPEVRATALGAVARLGSLTVDDLAAAIRDEAPVRRRAAGLLHRTRTTETGWIEVTLAMLDDPDPLVVETAAWSVGEVRSVDDAVGDRLLAIADTHEDPLSREAAVAALGSLGDERAVETIIAATTDKPTVRRRAVLALAPFEGPEVTAALERARTDRDRQVRQAAEDLLAPEPEVRE